MVDAALAALKAGNPVIVPTDTVYGLAASPYREEHVRRLYELKGRAEGQPTALVASDLELLFECVPELRGRSGVIARALLPGPYTLVFPNPSRRFGWLTGNRPDTIGVRVPALTGQAQEFLTRAGAVAATSANLPGGPDPRTLADVPDELLDGVAAVVDAGALPGTPSTVLEFVDETPLVVREGAAPSDAALVRVFEALEAARSGR